jgi:hypothetical protein
MGRAGATDHSRAAVVGPARNLDGVTEPPERRAHRPRLRSDLTAMIDAAGGEQPESVADRAAATAEAVVAAGREGRGDLPSQELVRLADIVGLDTLALLWRDADTVSLPGALWALYLLRQWCHADPDRVVALWRAGAPLAAADAMVVGVPEAPEAADLTRLADAVVAGVFDGDPAVALERGAAMFRVLATGRRERAAAAPVDDEFERALRHDRVAADLTAAARRWRAGTLH